MTQDATGLTYYVSIPSGDKRWWCSTPVAGYGQLRLLVDEGAGSFKGITRELTLDRVAHVPCDISNRCVTTSFDRGIFVLGL